MFWFQSVSELNYLITQKDLGSGLSTDIHFDLPKEYLSA